MFATGCLLQFVAAVSMRMLDMTEPALAPPSETYMLCCSLWAARYNTWLLVKKRRKAQYFVVFFFFFLRCCRLGTHQQAFAPQHSILAKTSAPCKPARLMAASSYSSQVF